MKFQLQGRAWQPVVEGPEDLSALAGLDATHWVATSAPTRALKLDPEFLRILDDDADQRIGIRELKNAIRWCTSVFSDLSAFETGENRLHLSAIQSDHPDGARIRQFFARMHADNGLLEFTAIRAQRLALEARPVSEAGVVLPDAAGEDDTREWMQTLLQLLPGAPHPSGCAGIDAASLDRFAVGVAARSQWQQECPPLDFLRQPDTLSAALTEYGRLQAGLAQYFALCQLTRLRPELPETVWQGLRAAAPLPAGEIDAALRAAPLAKPCPEAVLDLQTDLNPAWAEELQRFCGRFSDAPSSLTLPQWQQLQARLESCLLWKSREPEPAFAALPAADLAAMAASPAIGRVRELISLQTAAALDLQEVRLAEKAVLLQMHLRRLLRNFAAFPELYHPEHRALFEEGSLILDGRRFNLAIRVPDRAGFLQQVNDGSMFVMLVKLQHPSTPESMEVAVPATAGRKGTLRVGKHGVFRDTAGTEWFATVTQIVDQPISLSEAMLAPFQRLGAVLTRKVEQLTQNAENKLDQTGDLLSAPTPPPPPPQTPPGPAQTGQLLAGGGIAIAALGSSLAFMTKTFANLSLLQMLGGLLAAVLAVLLPSAIVAALRLRRRDLSLLLEASGWAINTRMRLSPTQRRSFTADPPLPKGSILLRERFWWTRWLLLILLLIFLILNLPHTP